MDKFASPTEVVGTIRRLGDEWAEAVPHVRRLRDLPSSNRGYELTDQRPLKFLSKHLVQLQPRSRVMTCSAAYELVERTARPFLNANKNSWRCLPPGMGTRSSSRRRSNRNASPVRGDGPRPLRGFPPFSFLLLFTQVPRSVDARKFSVSRRVNAPA
jgi:hypothetical protein